MRLLSALAFLGMVCAAAAGKPQYCSGSPTKINVSDVTVVRTADVMIGVKGTLASEVTSGNVNAQVFYMGINVVTGDQDLALGSKLPQGPGAFEYKSAQPLPSGAPSGGYAVHLTFSDQNSEVLACIIAEFSV